MNHRDSIPLNRRNGFIFTIRFLQFGFKNLDDSSLLLSLITKLFVSCLQIYTQSGFFFPLTGNQKRKAGEMPTFVLIP